jgi:hypothetical protein
VTATNQRTRPSANATTRGRATEICDDGSGFSDLVANGAASDRKAQQAEKRRRDRRGRGMKRALVWRFRIPTAVDDLTRLCLAIGFDPLDRGPPYRRGPAAPD